MSIKMNKWSKNAQFTDVEQHSETMIMLPSVRNNTLRQTDHEHTCRAAIARNETEFERIEPEKELMKKPL